MKSILITGAHGFIGRHLGRYCNEQWQATVVGLGHGTFSGSELTRFGMKYSLNGDVTSANLHRIVQKAGLPDIIFHLAGGNSIGSSLALPQEDFQRTVATTCELLDWVRINSPDSRVVLASSAAVYGSGYEQPISESAVTQPTSPYGNHKRMAEQLCESYHQHFGVRCQVARLFSVYGPDLRKQLLWDTCQKLASGVMRLQMQGTGNECRDWLHVSDCVSFLWALANDTRTQVTMNGGTGISTSVGEIVRALCQAWDENIDVEFNGHDRPGNPQYLVADIASTAQLNWVAQTKWQDGIQRYVEWFRATQLPQG